MLDSPYEIFDPRGVVARESRPLATRRNTLDGLRLGILDNSKWNANKLLRGAADALAREIDFAAVNYYVKTHGFSTDAPAELIDQIASENDRYNASTIVIHSISRPVWFSDMPPIVATMSM